MVDKVTAMIEALKKSGLHKLELLLTGGSTINCYGPLLPDKNGMLYINEGGSEDVLYRFLWVGDIVSVNVRINNPHPRNR